MYYQHFPYCCLVKSSREQVKYLKLWKYFSQVLVNHSSYFSVLNCTFLINRASFKEFVGCDNGIFWTIFHMYSWLISCNWNTTNYTTHGKYFGWFALPCYEGFLMKMIEKAEVGSIACFNKYEIQALQIQMMVHIISYGIIWLLIYY